MCLLQSLIYGQSTTYTCNIGYAVKGTTAQQCLKTQIVQCGLEETGVSVVPSLPNDHCLPAPCGLYNVTSDATSNDNESNWLHNDQIHVTCNIGYRAYSPEEKWNNCAANRNFPVRCHDCKWKDHGMTCQKVRFVDALVFFQISLKYVGLTSASK